MHCRTSSIILGLYPPNARSTSPLRPTVTTRPSPDIAKHPLESKIPPQWEPLSYGDYFKSSAGVYSVWCWRQIEHFTLDCLLRTLGTFHYFNYSLLCGKTDPRWTLFGDNLS